MAAGPRGSLRILLVGLGLIGAVFVAEAAADRYLTAGAEARARLLVDDSIHSVEILDRINRDVDQERVLLDDHVFEVVPAKMSEIEARVMAVRSDCLRAVEAYAVLIDQPDEAALWAASQEPLARFHRVVTETLAFSRKNMNPEARAKVMTEAQSTYSEVDDKLLQLIRINRAGALDAVKRIADLQRLTDEVIWAIRGVGFLVLLALGWAMFGRVRDYQAQLQRYARDLEQRNEDLDDFAGRVAHDLKGALGPIVLSPGLLRRAAADPVRVRELADRTEKCSLRANGIIEALLAFSRASAKPLADETGALRPVLASVVDEIAPLAAQLDATVEIEEIPDVRVRCDPDLLHVVFANVIGNAVKYLRGQRERQVRVSVREEAAAIRVEVVDTGPGIPEDARERIFEPFYRVRTNAVPGTGIGLATVRRVVDSRGGRVAVESAGRTGSRFQVWLPLAPLLGPQPAAPEPGLQQAG